VLVHHVPLHAASLRDLASWGTSRRAVPAARSADTP
jgi:hypothetical protein